MDSGEISEKIDQLETIFFDETEAESKFDEEDASEIEEIDAAAAEPHPTAGNEEIQFSDVDSSEEPVSAPEIPESSAMPISHDEIEKIIERIIQRDFSTKIEGMIAGVIEKAVSKEINRLKNILQENNDDD
jgi:hypothetical protein